MLAAQAGRQRPEPASTQPPLIWKAMALLPESRDTSRERNERVTRRRLISASLLSKAVLEAGGSLVDPLSIFSMGKGRVTTKVSKRPADWDNAIVTWAEAQDLASSAVGGKASISDETAVSWSDIIRARLASTDERLRSIKQIRSLLPKQESAKLKAESADDSVKSPVDPVVEAIKRSKNLTPHEKRLLPCIVDPTKLASTSFNDVHLPYKTIDGIRTLVSLPLLFPEAFKGGVLKDHSTGGALLFGPPGTGKTLLARAVASESGARMLAIQVSSLI